MNEINKYIQNKIQLLKDSTADIDIIGRIDLIQNNYELAYTELVHDLDRSTKTINDRKDDIFKLISTEETIDNLNFIANEIKVNNQLSESLDRYFKLIIPLELNIKSINICEKCNSLMDISEDRTKLECYVCNDSNITLGTIIDSTKNTYKYKHGNFKPNRHSKCWIDRILAKEDEEEIGDPRDPENLRGEKLIQKMINKCTLSGTSLAYITVDDGRHLLKDLKYTHLNKNISLIMKKVTGRGPPHINDELYQKAYTLFLQVMDVRENIKGANRSNRIYYPYYIYKIFDILLIDQNDRKLLNYIHLHKHPTLSHNDSEWQEICKNIPFLCNKYKPTMSGIKYI
jgi:hypothetical protein